MATDSTTSFNDTLLTEVNEKNQLSLKDIKQLLLNRGENKKNLKGSKKKLISLLKQNHDIDIPDLHKLTAKGLIVELKLRKLNHKSAKKQILIARLNGTEPCDEAESTIKHRKFNKLQFQQGPIIPMVTTNGECPNNLVYHLPHAIKIGKHQFVISQEIPNGQDYVLNVFNTNDRKWTESFKFQSHLGVTWSMDKHLCYDTVNGKLYFYREHYNSTYSIIEIDYANKYVIKEIGPVPSDDNQRGITFADNKLYLIKQQRNNNSFKQFVFNEENDSLEELCTLTCLEELGNWKNYVKICGLFHIKSQNSLLLIAGCKGLRWDWYNLYLFDLKAQTWRKLDIVISNINFEFIPVVTNNENDIILFCNKQNTNFMDNTNIYIVNLTLLTTRLSKIKCPAVCDKFCAVTTENEMEKRLIVFGYVRQCWRMDQFSLMRYPPDYIIRIILKWYYVEYVHLLESNGNHWMMNVDQILNDCV